MEDNNVVTQTPETENTDYIQAIQELKANSVPLEQYSKLKEENSKLLKSLINGETIEGVEATPAPDIAELRKSLFGGEELNNIEYVTKVLALRDATLEAGKPDPFLPWGEKISPTNEDIEAANRVAKVLKECVDYADGDSNLFTSELQRVMIDAGRRK